MKTYSHLLIVLFAALNLACSGLLMMPDEPPPVGEISTIALTIPLMVSEQGQDCIDCYLDCTQTKPSDFDDDDWPDGCEPYCVQNFGNFE